METEKQEPIARVAGTYGGRFVIEALNPALVLPVGMALYAKREWVGLTDERVYEIYERVQREVNEHWENGGTTMMFPIALYQAIEQALKEKNT